MKRPTFLWVLNLCLMLLLTSCDRCDEVLKDAFPLKGTWNVDNVKLRIQYRSGGNTYDRTMTALPTNLTPITFYGVEVDLLNERHNFRYQTTNGVKEIVLLDPTNDSEQGTWTYVLDGDQLVLTSGNDLANLTRASERVQQARTWAALLSTAPNVSGTFPGIQSATDASTLQLIFTCTRQ
jgi:hypothetical protein